MDRDDQRGKKPSAFGSRGGGALRGSKQQAARAAIQRAAGRAGRQPSQGLSRGRGRELCRGASSTRFAQVGPANDTQGSRQSPAKELSAIARLAGGALKGAGGWQEVSPNRANQEPTAGPHAASGQRPPISFGLKSVGQKTSPSGGNGPSGSLLAWWCGRDWQCFLISAAGRKQQQPFRRHRCSIFCHGPLSNSSKSRSPSPQPEATDDEDEPFDMEAARRAALSAMPSFAGSSQADKAPAQQQSGQPGPAGEDEQDAARKAQRAQRFKETLRQPASVQPSAPVQQPRQRPPERQDVSMGMDGEEPEGAFGSTRGTCETMCPDSEVDRRVRLNDFDDLERPPPGDHVTSPTALLVKRFARTIAVGKVEDFRTKGALLKTQAHLRTILDRPDSDLHHRYQFVWERFRSMRQDMYVQGMQDAAAVGMYEEQVRFMILGEHELCLKLATATNPQGHNSHLNIEQMNKALITLQNMYEHLKEQGMAAPNEAEFRAYQLMLAMGEHGKYFYSATGFFNSLKRCGPEILTSGQVQRVVALHRALHSGNWLRFFTLVAALPYLPACLCHAFFIPMQQHALSALIASGSKAAELPPLARLKHELLIDDERQAVALLESCGHFVTLGADGKLHVRPEHEVAALQRHKDMSTGVARLPSSVVTSKKPAQMSLALTTPEGSSSGSSTSTSLAATASAAVPATAPAFSVSNAWSVSSAPVSVFPSAAMQAPAFMQLPHSTSAPGLLPFPGQMHVSTGPGASTPASSSFALAASSWLSAAPSQQPSFSAVFSPGQLQQPTNMQLPFTSPSFPASTAQGGVQPAAQPVIVPPGLAMPPSWGVPSSVDQGHAAGAPQQQPASLGPSIFGPQPQDEEAKRQAQLLAEQQQEAERQARLQLDRRRQEELRIKRQAEEEQRKQRELQVQKEREQQQAREAAEAAEAARKARVAAQEAARKRREAEEAAEHLRLEQQEQQRQDQSYRDVYARWQRLQLARQQQQALASCRIGFSPSQSPLAEAFGGLVIGSEAEAITPTRLLASPETASVAAAMAPVRQDVQPLHVAKLLHPILAECNPRAAHLIWKASLLTQGQSPQAHFMQSLLTHGGPPGGQSSASKHWQSVCEQLQAAAECLPAGLNLPLAIVLQGEKELQGDLEDRLRSLLPTSESGSQAFEQWGVFLAEDLEHCSEALTECLQWLAEHAPAQPNLQAVSLQTLGAGFDASSLVAFSSGLLPHQISPLPNLAPVAASPTSLPRKRLADSALTDELSRLSPASGRRRLRSDSDKADVFAEVSFGTPGSEAHAGGDLAARLREARRANQDFEAVLCQQLAIGDVIGSPLLVPMNIATPT
ncbi:hypothetical protein WJX73_007053 [Symbiochloris irregularis]|uniref:SAC3/GANP/THP3 conserved domain-containing protein n=1 Tax=Symbiochloris irregularis TaxID=706552 RepID=A0AAW1NRZ1_9CHLO